MSLRDRLRKAIRNRGKRTRFLERLLGREEQAGRWRLKRTQELQQKANRAKRTSGKRDDHYIHDFRESRTRLRQQRRKVSKLRSKVAGSRRKLHGFRARLQRISGGRGAQAVKAAGRQVGKHETGYNDAPWLREMERDLVRAGAALSWMIPGQPYCGFGCDWSWLMGPHHLLPDDTVSTEAIARRARSGDRFHAVGASHADVGDLAVMNFGSGSPKHVALVRGRPSGGYVRTREFNTSPGNSGSQANGGGCYDRVRPLWMIHTFARPV